MVEPAATAAMGAEPRMEPTARGATAVQAATAVPRAASTVQRARTVLMAAARSIGETDSFASRAISAEQPPR